jgi:CheY-specific phosphatase CheX
MTNEVGVGVVIQIVESVFATMMDLEVCVIDAPWSPADDRLTSSVDLHGDWNGFVSVECNRHQACQFAAKFLSVDPPDAVDEDVRDVLGELANMIGGNIKSILAVGARLSTPLVTDGSNCELPKHKLECRDEIALNFAGGTFWVTIATDKAVAVLPPKNKSAWPPATIW